MARPAEAGPSRRRIGIFGGTFDPPHLGHVSVARDAADALDLDEVVWIPAGRPPHKDEDVSASAELRLAMTRAAVASDPRFRVEDLELRRAGPSYTVDTLRELRESAEAAEAEGADPAELILIMGHDQYGSLSTWRSPEEVRRLATLAVMDRGGMALDEPEGHGLLRVPVGRVDVSSSEIRERIGRGEDVSDSVPDNVLRIIRAAGLYRR